VDARGAALLAPADVEDQVLQLLRCSWRGIVAWNLGELPCLRPWQWDWTCVQCELLLRPRVPPPTRTLSGHLEWARLNRHPR
jgi:hypothetical protein